MQVLTLEDWEYLMYDTIAATNWGASLYFLAWVVLGYYIFLTLFLAVTLEAFESRFDEDLEATTRLETNTALATDTSLAALSSAGSAHAAQVRPHARSLSPADTLAQLLGILELSAWHGAGPMPAESHGGVSRRVQS